MNKQQYISGSMAIRLPKKSQENSFFTANTKQQIFSAHLSKLNRSRTDSAKQSDITLSSEYQNTFERYTKNTSLVDRIIETFDNGNIADLFHQRPQFTQSHIYLHLPPKIKQNIQEINDLFLMEGKSGQYQFLQPLTHQNYAKALRTLKEPFQFEQVKQIKTVQANDLIKPQNARSETVATHSPIESKVDLLLNQINFQKKRNDCPLYIHAMEAKLCQFIDYVVGDDDKYIGLSLQDKASELIKEINKFKGKILDGWLIFFHEFKELQIFKVQLMRMQKKSEESKHQIRSQVDAKSVKSYNSSIKKGKYSEPNTHRNTVKEQQWIGAIK